MHIRILYKYDSAVFSGYRPLASYRPDFLLEYLLELATQHTVSIPSVCQPPLHPPARQTAGTSSRLCALMGQSNSNNDGQAERCREAVVQFLGLRKNQTANIGLVASALPKSVRGTGQFKKQLQLWPDVFAVDRDNVVLKTALSTRGVQIVPLHSAKGGKKATAKRCKEAVVKFLSSQKNHTARTSKVAQAVPKSIRGRSGLEKQLRKWPDVFSVNNDWITLRKSCFMTDKKRKRTPSGKYGLNEAVENLLASQPELKAEFGEVGTKIPKSSKGNHRRLPDIKSIDEWQIFPRSSNQRQYAEALYSRDDRPCIIVATGPAGCGKTVFACQAAAQHLYAHSASKIIISRPAVTADEDIGFLPGNMDQKLAPYLQPIVDSLCDIWDKADLNALMAAGIVEVAPLAFMRGRTFKDAVVIADEMQNSTVSQMKLITSRLGEGSKLIITGDLQQTDRLTSRNGLADLVTLLKGSSSDSGLFALFEMDVKDVQRHEAVAEIIKLYNSRDQKGRSTEDSTECWEE